MLLEEMNDGMLKNLTTAADEETTAIKDYKDLAAAQKKEIDRKQKELQAWQRETIVFWHSL